MRAAWLVLLACAATPGGEGGALAAAERPRAAIASALLACVAALGGEEGALAAAEQPRVAITSAAMTRVAVFAGRAEVTRVLALGAASECAEGRAEQSLLLTGLPSGFEPGTLRVAGAGLRALVVEELLEAPTTQERRALLREQRQLVDAYAKARLAAAPDVQQASALLDFHLERQAQLAEELRREPRAESARLEMERGCAPLDLELRYVVGGVSWEPTYDLRLEHSHVDLEYCATVRQQSGEDWLDVALTLATTDPASSGTPPKARQRSIHFQEHLREDDGSLEGEEWQLRDMAQRTRRGRRDSAARPAVVLEAPRRVSLRSGPSAARLALGTYAMRTALTHFVTPTVSTAAHMLATVVNTAPLALLPGPLRSTVDGSLVATSQLASAVAPNASFTTFLGTDPALRVKVEPEVASFRKGSAWSLGEAATTFRSRTVLQNRKAVPVYVVVQQSVVVSRTDQIRVEVVRPEPGRLADAVDPATLPLGAARARLNNETGALTWAAAVAPESELALPLEVMAFSPRGRYVGVVDGGSIEFDERADAHAEL